MLPAKIARNTLLLALAMGALSLMVQLNAAFGIVTFVAVGGPPELVGFAPAFTFIPVAVGALLAGLAMDRIGRVPVLAAGFTSGIGGALLASDAASRGSLAELLIAFVLLGLAHGTGNLSRVAAADMYPPHRRAFGMALALMGAVAGALLGPALFAPILRGSVPAPGQLAAAWHTAAAAMGVGLALTLLVRMERAAASRTPAAEGPRAQATVNELVRRQGVLPVIGAAAASFAVMVAMMALSGHLALGAGQSSEDVLQAVAAHVIGMYAFGFGVGYVVDRQGPRRWLIVGLAVLSVSALALALAQSALVMAMAMFMLGLGWNCAFVAASAWLVREALPTQRGRVLGLSDLLSGLAGALLAILGGLVSYQVGPAALGLGMAMVALAPIPFLLRARSASVVVTG